MTPQDSQVLETFLPVYDSVPEKWEDSRMFLIEHLKRISNAVNFREIGLYIDDEILSGGQFIPTSEMSESGQSSNSQQFTTILRKVINCSPLVNGANSFAHGITFDANFTLIKLWCAATNSSTLVATVFANSDTINLSSTDVNITSNGAYNRAFAFIEYIQET